MLESIQAGFGFFDLEISQRCLDFTWVLRRKLKGGIKQKKKKREHTKEREDTERAATEPPPEHNRPIKK